MAAVVSSSTFAGSKLSTSNSNASSTSIKKSMVRLTRCQASAGNDGATSAEAVQRRALVAGAGAAALAVVLGATIGGNANAVPPVPPGEPKPGSKEARKKYANICVAMPTASICHY